MLRLFYTILANALGIYVATWLVAGFIFSGTYLELTIAAVILALINWGIRPLVKFVSSPIIFITFGLFVLVVNMAMLWLLDILTPSLVILNLAALFWGSLIIGFINTVLVAARKRK